MAFNASTAQNVNGYSSTATYINKNSLYRTNPYANSEGINAEQLYGVDTYEDRIPVSFSWHIAMLEQDLPLHLFMVLLRHLIT